MVAPPSRPISKRPQQWVSPWAWGFLVISLIVVVIVLLATVWQPTLLPVELVNPNTLRPLPGFLDFRNDDEIPWLPLVLTIGLAAGINFVPSNNYTRFVFRWFVFFLGVRYIVWRGMATLNFAHWFSLSFSVLFFGLECIYFVTYGLYILQTSWLTEERRTREANHYQTAVLDGSFSPSVDVLIPTYNESVEILRRTIISCQSINYANKKVYVLDDGRRPAVEKLCQELRCEYIIRPDNSHRKAGNLNHALKHTSGDLITVFDADFIPFQNFLARTVGFFQNPNISLVQTPQHFYNPDYHSQNLGLDYMLPGDMDYFFGYIQPGRDAGNAIICCGTSYVVRRKDLESVGGYYTRCIVEDFQTGTRMQIKGYRLIYLNEILSMGESPRNLRDHLDQRLRWLQGNMQIYYCGDELPIWSKLNWFQKSCHLSLVLYNFNSFIRAAFVYGPLLSLITGVSLTVASVSEYAYYALPYTFLNIVTFSWATKGRYFSLWGEVYEIIFAAPAIRHLIAILRNPFGRLGTVATAKGTTSDRKRYNLDIIWPWLLFLGLTVLAIFIRYGGYFFADWPFLQYERKGLEVMLIWTAANAFLVLIAVLSSIDQPVRRQADRFPVCTVCCLTIGGQSYWGYTQNLSETGAAIRLTAGKRVPLKQAVKILFLEGYFTVDAEIIRTQESDDQTQVFVRFAPGRTQMPLINILYGSLTWWNVPKTPSGLDAFLAMLARLFDFRSLFTFYSSRP